MTSSTPPTSVVLLSGGLDSAVALAWARAQGSPCHAVSFDYGQRHRVELSAAAALAGALGAASHRVIRLDLRAIGGSALTADIDVPKDRPAAATDIPITYVPARNLIFLSLATGLAEVLGAHRVIIGVNAVDYSGYPDCRPQFIGAFEVAANLATCAGATTPAHPLEVITPLAGLSKHAIIALGLSLGVDFSLTTSCYDPDPQGLACAHCDACLLRAQGFARAGVTDPTHYRTPTSPSMPTS